jgi:hypothetical protein
VPESPAKGHHLFLDLQKLLTINELSEPMKEKGAVPDVSPLRQGTIIRQQHLEQRFRMKTIGWLRRLMHPTWKPKQPPCCLAGYASAALELAQSKEILLFCSEPMQPSQNLQSQQCKPMDGGAAHIALMKFGTNRWPKQNDGTYLHLTRPKAATSTAKHRNQQSA